MKVKTNSLEQKKPVRVILWAIIIIFVSITVFFGRNSFLKAIMYKRETAKLEEKVNLLRAENEKLKKENHELKTNPEVIEKIAREQLGYQKTDEKVYRFIPPEAAETPAKKKE